MDTKGFYKVDNGVLLHAPNFVQNKNYTLNITDANNTDYPVDGWYFFESLEAAKEFFGEQIVEPAE
jgi:hypothetical protein